MNSAALSFDPRQAFDALLATPPNQVSKYDVAFMNLACAYGLPGAETLDIAGTLAILDQWATRIGHETERHLYRFHQNPADYQNSEAYFRMMMMSQVLCEDFGIHYQSDSEGSAHDLTLGPPLDAQYRFLSGLLGPSRTGTCSSMPVLYVSLGRRLGYPLYLVRVPCHVFARWEDSKSKERFNIEATENLGFGSPPDEHYLDTLRAKGVSFRQREVDSEFYLKNLTPAEELGLFFDLRGACWYSHKRWIEALRAYSKAACLNIKDAVSPNIGHAITHILLFKDRPPRDPCALVGNDPQDPSYLLAPEDAARSFNLSGHAKEIEGNFDVAQFAYTRACEFNRSVPDFHFDLKRLEHKMMAKYLAEEHPLITADQFLAWGRVAENAQDDLYTAQALYARAASLGSGIVAHSGLHRVVRRELTESPAMEQSDLRAVLPQQVQSLIFAARGANLEASGQFAEARDNFAIAARLGAGRGHHHSVVRNDRKEQERQDRLSHGGQASPASRKPLLLKTVSIHMPAKTKYPTITERT